MADVAAQAEDPGVRGEISSAAFEKRHPLDWYVDPDWCAHQLVRHLANFRHEKVNGIAVWDPCAGRGNTLAYPAEYGATCFASDLVDNFDWEQFDAPHVIRPEWFSADFLEQTAPPAERCSIVMNPPYSYQKGIAEAFVRHALALATERVYALVPNKWLSSQARFALFEIDHPPAQVLHLTQRPSMPPGDRIELMGTRAFRGGMIDYCWIVWDLQFPTPRGETRVRWLPPLTLRQAQDERGQS